MDALVRELPERRAEFAAALRELADKLSTDPETEGESREEGIRVGFFGRLTARYRAARGERRVYVLDVHLPADNL